MSQGQQSWTWRSAARKNNVKPSFRDQVRMTKSDQGSVAQIGLNQHVPSKGNSLPRSGSIEGVRKMVERQGRGA